MRLEEYHIYTPEEEKYDDTAHVMWISDFNHICLILGSPVMSLTVASLALAGFCLWRKDPPYRQDRECDWFYSAVRQVNVYLFEGGGQMLSCVYLTILLH